MGILNVTPDSFSDGGRYIETASAVQRAGKMISQGASIIDVGGESSRPGSRRIDAQTELERVIPVISSLAAEHDVLISVDTYKSEVAREALSAGAHIVNDISAGRGDDEMFKLIAEERCGYVMMHMQGTPENMQAAPHYENVTREIIDFFRDRLDQAYTSGADASRIAIDPGIGFGKTLYHNLQLMADLEQFSHLEAALLFGASRKSFIDMIRKADVQHRLGGSLAAAMLAVQKGAKILRVHDVYETRQALDIIAAINRPADYI